MRAQRVYAAVDSHTEGMPTRVVTAGVGVLPGATMLERKLALERDADDLRGLLMHEPRGHAAMSGAILQPPTRPDADWGVVFIEVSGYLAMCGHGTIGVATVLVETGMVTVAEPTTTIRLDTPAGLVVADVAVRDGHAESVTIRNVPSFLAVRDLEVDGGQVGRVTLDVAYGGNFYAIVPAEDLGVPLVAEAAGELIRRGLQVMDGVNAAADLAHPLDPAIRGCRHVLVTTPRTTGDGDAPQRSTVVIHPGWLDRSPCGTGTSARMAQLHARGELGLGQRYVQESIIGSRFTGELVEQTSVDGLAAVVPTVRGRAWLTGMGNYLLDPTDPFPAGFRLGGRSDADLRRAGRDRPAAPGPVAPGPVAPDPVA